jgi:hypothetical protein
MKSGNLKRYGFAWVTLSLFLLSLAGQWIFGWLAYVGEQATHQQPVDVSEYSYQMLRGMFENWQSEFLQLLWQVGGLAMLFYVGSPQSKDGDDRKEAKLDAILKAVQPEKAESLIRKINNRYENPPD